MALDATPGGVSANSYATVAEADAYFADRAHAEAWAIAGAPEKAQALVTATRRLDQEDYRGQRATEAQPLAWPRSGVEESDGWPLASDRVPPRIRDAACELALVLLGSDLLAETGLEGFAEVAVGSLKVVPRADRGAGELPEHVRRAVRPYLASGGATVRLVRG